MSSSTIQHLTQFSNHLLTVPALFPRAQIAQKLSSLVVKIECKPLDCCQAAFATVEKEREAAVVAESTPPPTATEKEGSKKHYHVTHGKSFDTALSTTVKVCLAE
jgi:hypothetical protein